MSSIYITDRLTDRDKHNITKSITSLLHLYMNPYLSISWKYFEYKYGVILAPNPQSPTATPSPEKLGTEHNLTQWNSLQAFYHLLLYHHFFFIFITQWNSLQAFCFLKFKIYIHYKTFKTCNCFSLTWDMKWENNLPYCAIWSRTIPIWHIEQVQYRTVLV